MNTRSRAATSWLKQINSVLNTEWAPIAGSPPDDEYESYAARLGSMILAGNPDARLLSYLEWAEVENMGLGGPFARERAEKVVAALRSLGLPPASN